MVKLIIIASLVLLAAVCVIASSWDTYIDQLITQSKDGKSHIDRACIIGRDGSRWTSDNHATDVKLKENEAVTISTAMKQNDYTDFKRNGINIEGVKYQFVETEDQQVLGRKRGLGSVILKATKNAVIIAHVPESSITRYAKQATVTIAGYLERMGI